MSAADAQARADALITDAEAQAKAYMSRFNDESHYAYECGVLRGTVRDLCRELAGRESIEGICGAISLLPSRHGELRAVIAAVFERITHEASLEATYGYDAVSDALDDALTCMGDCGEYDEDELAQKRRCGWVSARHDERRDDVIDDDIRF